MEHTGSGTLNPGNTGTSMPGPDRSSQSRFQDFKNVVADKLHDAAGALRERAGAPQAETGVARYGNQASTWLDQSAEYVRAFDAREANHRIREYIRRNPGRSLLMAGVAGLALGTLLRRR
jgi:ElaB/YqjD/DUF883 family membrane-anchored ribosome-binding protein